MRKAIMMRKTIKMIVGFQVRRI